MACCKRKWCDYVSFNADLPENMRVAIIRCPRDVDMISEMEAEVRKFQAELAEKVGLLREKFPS
jgi:chromosome condensin MukBEF ATPase and DNA-binding subunit MukB